VKHPNFDLMHSISFCSRFVFDEFIAKGGEYVHKVGRTLANRVVERRNVINVYLTGSACIKSVRGSLIQGEFLSFVRVFEFCELFVFFSFSWLFFAILAWFAAFHACCWCCGFSLY
jgi:hypothetical protein